VKLLYYGGVTLMQWCWRGDAVEVMVAMLLGGVVFLWCCVVVVMVRHSDATQNMSFENLPAKPSMPTPTQPSVTSTRRPMT
jgi:hypothetical protein